MLANIYAHYCIDTWFDNHVKPSLIGEGHLVRYADDMCICLTLSHDAERVMKSLRNRLTRFGLKLNETKSSLVSLNVEYN